MSLKQNLKNSFIFQIYSFFTVKESVNSVSMNKLGATYFRVLLAELFRKTQSLFYPSKDSRAQQIKDHGYTLLENFFTAEQVHKLKEGIQHYISSVQKSHSQDGAQYIVRNIEELNLFSKEEIESFKDKILTVSQPYLGKIDRNSLHMHMHAVKRQDGLTEDSSDINLLMHSDTYHKTLKGFLYLEPLDIEDGPFEYVKGSHVIDRKRLSREYKNSTDKEVLKRDHGGWRFENVYYKDLESRKFTGVENTMIVADTFGLHRRNPRSKPGFRISIHFSLRKSPFSLTGKITG